MSGLLNALTSAIGEALGEIRGQIMTRLDAPARAASQVARGTQTGNSLDGIAVTLSAGTLGSAAAGQIFRALSGALAGEEAAILSIGGPTAAGLAGAGLGASFSSISWEIERPSDTELTLESTLYWADAGEFFLGGTRHRYTGRTPTTLTGISHYDGESWVPGVSGDFEPGAVVVDYGRHRTAIDMLRRSFFVETATDPELEAIGANNGKPRREGLEPTERFRSFLRAAMYSPWGTRLAIRNILDALLGADAWEIFEDFTDPTADFARVYVRRTTEDTTLVGRAILDGAVLRPAASSTTAVLTETPLRVSSVVLAPDVSEREVASGVSAATTNGSALTSAAEFPSRILPGDRFEVLSGPLTGEWGRVQAWASTSAITLGPLEGHGLGALSGASAAFAWRVVRDVTDCRRTIPSGDVAPLYPGGSGVATWNWQGTASEGSGATLVNDAAGRRTTIGSPADTQTGYYRHQARVVPESYARLDVLCRPVASTVLSATDGAQSVIAIHDGERAIAVGFFGDGVDVSIALINASTGAALTALIPIDSADFHHIVLEKRGRGRVYLWVDGQVILSGLQTAGAASAVNELQIGCVSATHAALNGVRSISWSIETETDYWAARSAVATTDGASDNVGGLGGFLAVGDVGRTLHVRGGNARNAAGGTVNGEWEVTARVDANTATVVGRTRPGATFRRGFPNRIFLPEDFALSFPDAMGHSIEILEGAEVGVYPISAMVAPDGSDLGSARDSFRSSSGGEANIRDLCIAVDVTGAPVDGFTASDGTFAWRIVPNFPADTGLLAELSDAGTIAGTTTTLRQALPITAFTVVLAISYSMVLSAHIQGTDDVNDAATPLWPFYLYDPWGLLRITLSDVAAEGVELNLDSLFRDAAGLHISPDD